ncbi:hypothetical protein JCM6882_003028 [Rhodosporidiobolus microsporus]
MPPPPSHLPSTNERYLPTPPSTAPASPSSVRTALLPGITPPPPPRAPRLKPSRKLLQRALSSEGVSPPPSPFRLPSPALGSPAVVNLRAAVGEFADAPEGGEIEGSLRSGGAILLFRLSSSSPTRSNGSVPPHLFLLLLRARLVRRHPAFSFPSHPVSSILPVLKTQTPTPPLPLLLHPLHFNLDLDLDLNLRVEHLPPPPPARVPPTLTAAAASTAPKTEAVHLFAGVRGRDDDEQ